MCIYIYICIHLLYTHHLSNTLEQSLLILWLLWFYSNSICKGKKIMLSSKTVYLPGQQCDQLSTSKLYFLFLMGQVAGTACFH